MPNLTFMHKNAAVGTFYKKKAAHKKSQSINSSMVGLTSVMNTSMSKGVDFAGAGMTMFGQEQFSVDAANFDLGAGAGADKGAEEMDDKDI